MTFLREFFAGVGVEDVVGAAGAGCVVYGIALWSMPAAWVVSGLMLVGFAVWPAIRLWRQ